jgi:hypothetical protein
MAGGFVEIDGLHRTLQILSVHPLEKIALHEILMKSKPTNPEPGEFNQMQELSRPISKQ